MNDFETCVKENDDELIIPDKYMKMTSDELDEEIERLEKLAQERHKSAEKKSKDVSGIKFII